MSGRDLGIIFVVALALIGVLVVGLINTPSAADCADFAIAENIPCVWNTVEWDEDECECRSNQGYEIEFDLPSHGGCTGYDD